MKVAEFERLLEGEMHFPPTVGQKRFFYAFSRFIFSDKAKCCLILQGYAGTGKTTLLGVITRALPKIKVRTVLLAPTGRAAKVLSLHAGKKASTIHKKIYFRETGKDGSSYFVRAKNLHKNTLFIVDEASMIGHRGLETVDSLGGRSLLEDLTE